MLSLKQRLTLTLALLTGGLFLIFGLVLIPVLRSLLLAEFDHALKSKVEALTAPTTPGSQGFSLRFTETPPSEFQSGQRLDFYEVLAPDGQLVARSPSLGNASLAQPPFNKTHGGFYDVTLPGQRSGRAVALHLTLPSEGATNAAPAFAVILARDTARLHRALWLMAAALFAGALSVAAIAVLLIPAIARASLLPISELSRQVTGISASSLFQRLNVRDLPAELRPIADELNALLGRLQNAFEREQRFSANLSHELLTPVAELRSLAQNAASWRGDPEITADFANDVIECSREMETILQSMLRLARYERGDLALKEQDLDVAAMLRALVEKAEHTDQGQRVTLRSTISEDLSIIADPAAAKSVLQNLLENAIMHAPAGTPVSCATRENQAGIRICFQNTNPGLGREDLAKLWEPFWRKDQARSSRAHSGLGLSISKALADALGWELHANLHDDTFLMEVFIPSQKRTHHKVLVS